MEERNSCSGIATVTIGQIVAFVFEFVVARKAVLTVVFWGEEARASRKEGDA